MTMKHLTLLLFVFISASAYAQNSNPADSGYTISVTMPYVGAGESFRYGLAGTSLTVTVTRSNTPVSFPGRFTSGTAYTVNQLDGPRVAQIMSGNNSGTITEFNVNIIAEGGGGPNSRIFIQGYLKAPVGTKVVLRNNGKDPITVTTPPSTTATWSMVPFKFPATVPDTSHCTITAVPPPGMTAMVLNGVYGYGNNIPARGNQIVVVCDYNYEHVSSSLKPSKVSTYYETGEAAFAGSLAEEGRYVAFVSSAAGLAGSTGKHRQVFLRDRTTGTTVLISKSANGEEGNGDSYAPTMNVNGHKLAFESHATNLVEGDQNGHRDIFVWDKYTPGLTRITVNPQGAEANGDCYEPSLSNPGEEIAFTSTANNLTPGVPDTYTPNVFLYNFNQHSFKLISADPVTGKAVGGSKPFYGNAKRRVVFCSYASTLVPNDRNNLWDIFLYEPGSPLKRISVPEGGGERNQGQESSSRVVAPSISGNGNWVTFATTATNMVPDDNNNKQDAFEVEVATGKVYRISVNSQGQEANDDCPIGQGERIDLSYDGSLSVFSSHASNFGVPEYNIIMHNLNTGESRPITRIKGAYVGQPLISMRGNYVVFGTGEKLDPKVASSGLFAAYTGLTGARFQYQYMSLY